MRSLEEILMNEVIRKSDKKKEKKKKEDKIDYMEKINTRIKRYDKKTNNFALLNINLKEPIINILKNG